MTIEGAERREPRAAWFSAEQQSALEDFWRVYEANQSMLHGEALRLSLETPALAGVIRGTTPERFESQLAAREHAILSAKGGDWVPFAALGRAQGAGFARSGVRFTSWNAMLAAITRTLIPHVVRAYCHDASRLIAALDVTQRFFDQLMTVVCEEYLRVRDELEAERAESQLRSREALQAKNELFRALIEKSEEGISLTARDGTTLYLSPAVERILGHSVDGRVGQNGFKHVHPDDRAVVYTHLMGLAERPGESATTEFRILRDDDSWTWIEATGTNMLADPAVGGIIGNFRNVTRRREAIDELRESEARYRRIVETAREGVVTRDPLGRITFVNGRMAAMVGHTPQEMIGRPFLEFLPPAEHARAQAMAEERARGIAGHLEMQLLRSDGTILDSEVDSTPVLDDAGGFMGVLAMVTDVTERKRAEKALRHTEEQLRQSQKMEAVGRLAGGVAHDFNNILSVILSLSTLACGDLKPGEPLRDDLEEIHNAGKRAAELTRQLLLFSRQQAIEPRVIDLAELLTNMGKMLGRLVGEDVEVVTVCAPGKVRVDPSGIEQVVMNLVVNARDAMPHGGKLTIETANVVLDEEYARGHHSVRPGPYVMLAVTDNGGGMDRETQARIFEPFFTTKETGKGTGLGLSTVFGIVQQSGGSVWVYSEVGHGTTFKLYFPRVDAEADVARPRAEIELGRGTESILLVEDEDAVRAVVRSILRRQGYTVIEARNAGEALLLCEQHEGAIELLVTDVVMPRMNGPELALRLKQLRPAMKVLCMSGYTDDSVVRHGFVGSAFAYIQKPVTPDALARKVREVLDASRG